MSEQATETCPKCGVDLSCCAAHGIDGLWCQLKQGHNQIATLQAIVDKLLPSGDGYIIVSFKRGYCGDFLVMWRPDSCGYTAILSEAGVYAQEEADRLTRHSEGEAVAIPVAKACELAVAALDSERGASRVEIEAIATQARKAGE